LAGSLRAEATLAGATGLFLALLLLGGIVVPPTQLPAAGAAVARLRRRARSRICCGSPSGARPTTSRHRSCSWPSGRSEPPLSPSSRSAGNSPEKDEPRVVGARGSGIYELVAGEGFEPPTFGL